MRAARLPVVRSTGACLSATLAQQWKVTQHGPRLSIKSLPIQDSCCSTPFFSTMYATHENLQYCITADMSVSGPVVTPIGTLSGSASAMLSGSTIAVPESFDEPQQAAPSTSAFRPTLLVRTSDMTVVPGYTAVNGYCALSYSSSWTGESTSDPPSNLRQQLHTLIDYSGVISYADILSSIQQEQVVFDNEDEFNHNVKGRRYFIKHRRVELNDIIQHLCRHFNIEYIWYDKMCIDQTNQAMRRNELQQIHQIYGNAQYTIAMVPEMQYQTVEADRQLFDDDGVDFNTRVIRCLHQLITSQWSHRVWTFAEAVLSQKVLFVGRNVHVWSNTIADSELYWKLRWDSDDLDPVYFLQTIVTKPANITVSKALSYVHRRQCSKPHDRIFTLAALFPEFIDGITLSYTQPILQLMTQFYRFLAAKDFALLCFGRLVTHEEQLQLLTRQNRGFMCIPSWTGIQGTHVSSAPFIRYPPKTNFSNYYSLDDGYLRIKASFIAVYVDPVDREMFDQAIISSSVSLVCTYEFDMIDQYNKVTIMSLDSWSYHAIHYSFGLSATHQFGSKGARNYLLEECDFNAASTAWLSLTEEYCKECIVLTGVPFEIDLEGFTAYPVIKRLADTPFERSKEFYTSIGLCFIRNLEYLQSSYQKPCTFTII